MSNLKEKKEYLEKIKKMIPILDDRLGKVKQFKGVIANKLRPKSFPESAWTTYIAELNNQTDCLIKSESEYIGKVKSKMTGFDVYNQKFSCKVCDEIDCICYESAEIRLPAGKDSIDSGSINLLELPF